MRLLSELVGNEGSAWDEVIIELLAGQVIAYAAYHHLLLDNAALILRTAYSVAGYPSILKPGMADSLVARVNAILGAKTA